jgi:DHA1 family tetracycline resistance protein-like MFS transporter
MFSMIAWIIVANKLPESRPAGSNQGTESRVIGREGVRTVMRDYRLQLLVLSSALLIMGWSSLEGTFSLFLKRRMGYTPSQASWAFAFLGFVGAFGQGFLIRRLVVRFGEKKLVVAGMCTLIVGFLMLSQVNMTALLLPTLVVVGLGQGMANPSMTSLVSRSSGPAVQGAVFGAMTSAQTFARMLNYSFANQLLGRFGESAPFYTGAMALLLGLIVVRMAIRRLNEDPVDIHSHGS